MLEGLVFHSDHIPDALYSDRRYIDTRILARNLRALSNLLERMSYAPQNDIHSISFVAELQAVMVEGVADPGAAQAKGGEALVILQPETLIFESVNLSPGGEPDPRRGGKSCHPS